MNASPAPALPPLRGRRERGVVLVVSLLMLLVLTFIGLAATRSTTIEQRLTSNQRDLAVAVQGAEAALRDGESLLNSAGLPNFALNTAGAFTAATMGTTDWTNIDWSETSTATLQYEGGIGGLPGAQQPLYKPRYFVVLTTSTIGGTSRNLSSDTPLPLQTVYYVFARSVNMSGDRAVVLESAYRR